MEKHIENEYGRIMDMVGRQMDALDELRKNDMDDLDMKIAADMLYLLVYYKGNEDVQKAFRKLWFDLLEAGVLDKKEE